MNQRYAYGVVAALAMAGVAQAGFVDLTGGWRASWDASLDGLVDIADDGVVNGVQFIEKSAEFLDGPANPGDPFPAIAITFTQIAPSPTLLIGINDEIITNSTGIDWTDFHMEVIGEFNPRFNPTLTAASGGGGPIGFSIAPFTNAAFSDGDTKLDIDGGVVPNGTIWRPGSGASDGILYIDTPNFFRGDEPGVALEFTLVERPTPAPGAAMALGAMGLLGLRRRVR
jgi:hypothetical protein